MNCRTLPPPAILTRTSVSRYSPREYLVVDAVARYALDAEIFDTFPFQETYKFMRENAPAILRILAARYSKIAEV